MTDSKVPGDKMMESIDKAIALAKELQTKFMNDSKAPAPRTWSWTELQHVNYHEFIGRHFVERRDYERAVTELEEKLAVAVEALDIMSIEANREAKSIGFSARRGDQSKADTFRFIRDTARETLTKIRKAGSDE